MGLMDRLLIATSKMVRPQTIINFKADNTIRK
jgi:hypothetical protein